MEVEEEEEMTGGCGNRKDDDDDDAVTPSPPTSPADAAPRRSSRLRVTKKDRERDREAWLELQEADETKPKRARRM